MKQHNYLYAENVYYIESLLEQYQSNPEGLDDTWRYFFEGMELGQSLGGGSGTNLQVVESRPKSDISPEAILSEIRVANLIESYREFGHTRAQLDPLQLEPDSSHASLSIEFHGLSQSDLKKNFFSARILGLGDSASLQRILDHLQNAYCRTLGFELAPLTTEKERRWMIEKIERPRPALDTDTKRFLFTRLAEAECLERFLHTRYVAQKRFSIEGGESAIPALDSMFEGLAARGVKEIIIGMAHRGRLNVLVNTMGKNAEYLFTEFEGTYTPDEGSEGDVKYHLGYSRDFKTRQGHDLHLSLAFNPSHLEFVNPVVEGMARAKQDLVKDSAGAVVAPIQIHGDAAFSGQGVCFETLVMSGLSAYNTGGTIHLIINNQVGFTTSPYQSRATRYCTDIAKVLSSPIIHVNGDDPESVWWASQVAAEYRQEFRKDVFIDLVCYRRHGHNEGDEPGYTQPVIYKKIKEHKTTREIYGSQIADGGAIVDEINSRLLGAQKIAKEAAPHPKISAFERYWQGLRKASESDLWQKVETAVSADTLKAISELIYRFPSDFKVHPKLEKFFEARLNAVSKGHGIDWGCAETLAYASILHEGGRIRMTGQDVERGTFTHRHATLRDFETGKPHSTLMRAAQKEATLSMHNSLLSEMGVLGFEYGYSISDPRSLVIWEAQFGDFANGAQVIIDQFIATSETKWSRMSGITLLLPHGYEGQGPEHSSARLERFLQICGKNNIVVCNPSQPAQIFHALRRQLKWEFRKPLIVMSPKSLLRNPAAVSSLNDLTSKNFREVIGEEDPKILAGADGVKRVVLCTGKVYYELAAARSKSDRIDTAIIRVEQLYPWPKHLIEAEFSKFKNAATFVWAQEEPKNMGAWQFFQAQWNDNFGQKISYAGREVCASPAVGSPKVHEKEQRGLIERALSQ